MDQSIPLMNGSVRQVLRLRPDGRGWDDAGLRAYKKVRPVNPVDDE